MKKIIIVLSLFFIVIGCSEKKSRIELIENNEIIYYSISELKSKPVLKNDIDEIKKEIVAAFMQKIKDIDSQSFPIFFAYDYFVGNNGRIEKLMISTKVTRKREVIRTKGSNLPENYSKEIEPEILKILEKIEFTSDSSLVKFKSFLDIRLDKEFQQIVASVSFNLDTPNFLSGGNVGNDNFQDIYFVSVEDMPSPIGGLEAFQKKITYPEIAKRAGIQGRVFVKAFIDEKGNVVKSEIIKGIDPILDQTALDAVSKTKFIPGKQRGIPVKTQVSIPIIFKLTDKDETSESNLGTITGKITDKNNSETSAANLFLEGTTIGAASDFLGKYIIKNIPPASYKLRVTHPDYKTKIIDINVGAKTSSIDIILEKK